MRWTTSGGSFPVTTVAPCRMVGAEPASPIGRPPLPLPDDVDSTESDEGTTSAPSVARSFGDRPLTPPGHGSHELEGHAYSVTIAPGVFSSVRSSSAA